MPWAERVRQLRPAIDAKGHLFVGQQAAVQFRSQAREVDVLADEHQFLPAIARSSGPVFHDRGGAFFVLRPMGLGHKTPPAPGKTVTHQPTGLGPATRVLMLAGEPEEAFGAQQFAIHPFTIDEAEKPFRVKRSTSAVGRRSDAIFLSLRGMFTAQFLEPAWRLGRALEVKTAGI